LVKEQGVALLVVLDEGLVRFGWLQVNSGVVAIFVECLKIFLSSGDVANSGNTGVEDAAEVMYEVLWGLAFGQMSENVGWVTVGSNMGPPDPADDISNRAIKVKQSRGRHGNTGLVDLSF